MSSLHFHLHKSLENVRFLQGKKQRIKNKLEPNHERKTDRERESTLLRNFPSQKRKERKTKSQQQSECNNWHGAEPSLKPLGMFSRRGCSWRCWRYSPVDLKWVYSALRWRTPGCILVSWSFKVLKDK